MNDRRIPDLWVEQAALGELDGRRRAALDSEALEDRVEAVRRSDAELLRRHPPAVVAAGIRARLRSGEGRPGSARWFALAAVPALATLVFLVAPHGATDPGGPHADPLAAPSSLEAGAPETTRIKGDAGLVVYRRAARGPESLSEGDRVRRGDVLQLGYRAAGARHGVLLSYDGRGAVTLHFPASADGATALEQGGTVLLPFAYALDDAPDFERFVFVYGDAPIDVPAVLRAARGAGDGRAPLSFGRGLTSRSLLLRKAPEAF